jgi:hypothetical protein
MRGEMPACMPIDAWHFIGITFTNKSYKKLYVYPAAIGFEVFLPSGARAPIHQFSHSQTKADSTVYKLNPGDSVRFRAHARGFADYTLAEGEKYYCIGTYIGGAGEKKVGEYQRIKYELISNRMDFSVCKSDK